MSTADGMQKLVLQNAPWEKFESVKPLIRAQLADMKTKMSTDEFTIVSAICERVLRIQTKEQWERFVRFVAIEVDNAFTAIMAFEDAGPS